MKKLCFLLLTGIMMMLYSGCTNTQAGTLIGAGVGAGAGYAIGNEMDK